MFVLLRILTLATLYNSLDDNRMIEIGIVCLYNNIFFCEKTTSVLFLPSADNIYNLFN